MLINKCACLLSYVRNYFVGHSIRTVKIYLLFYILFFCQLFVMFWQYFNKYMFTLINFIILKNG